MFEDLEGSTGGISRVPHFKIIDVVVVNKVKNMHAGGAIKVLELVPMLDVDVETAHVVVVVLMEGIIFVIDGETRGSWCGPVVVVPVVDGLE